VKRFIWIGGFFSLIFISGSSLAMDCRLGEEYYHLAKSAGDPKRSIEWLYHSLEACPSFNAWYMLGILYKNQGRTNQAIDAFANAREKDGPSRAEAMALARRGELLAQTGQLFQALHSLKLAKRFHPEPAPDWLEKSLKDTRIQSYRIVMPAEDIAAFLESGTQTSRDGRFAVRPGVNIPVQFDFDRSDLNSLGMRQITELGGALTRAKMRPWFFLLVGHTDKRGTMEYNQHLSENRAQTVKMELERRFPLLKRRLEIEGRGETEPLYDGDSELDHMLNRRVKVTLIDSGFNTPSSIQ
jgi:outer membrane protein OmpA-like peptidoglycan-associated protein